MDVPHPIRPFATAALAFAALIAFFSTPLLRFIDPSAAYAFGYGFALGVACLLLGLSGTGRVMTILGVVLVIALSGALFVTGDRAIAASHANDRRCLAIQRDMLSAHPRRADGPDLFQALGCRPQGEGSVYAPPRR